MDRNAFRRCNILLFQLLLVSGGIALIALTPPAQGAMLAIPLVPQLRTAGVDHMIAAGARIERAGPTPGSLVLVADRNAIGAQALRHGILLLPSYVAGCRTSGASA